MLFVNIKKLVSVGFLLTTLVITPLAKAQMPGMYGMYSMDNMMGMQGMMTGMYGMNMPGMYNNGMYAMGMTGMYGNTGMLYGFIAGNVLGTKGWFERRSNGQLVLYPVGVANNFSAPGGMMGMSTMFSMDSLEGKNKLNTDKIGQVSQGWYWIAPNGHLVLSPVSGLFGSTGTQGTEDSMEETEEQETPSEETTDMSGM